MQLILLLRLLMVMLLSRLSIRLNDWEMQLQMEQMESKET